MPLGLTPQNVGSGQGLGLGLFAGGPPQRPEGGHRHRPAAGGRAGRVRGCAGGVRGRGVPEGGVPLRSTQDPGPKTSRRALVGEHPHD